MTKLKNAKLPAADSFEFFALNHQVVGRILEMADSRMDQCIVL